MKIVFNGNVFELSQACDLNALLNNTSINTNLKLDQAVVAVNHNFIHRNNYADYQMKDGDEIEMLTAVVGG